jgi:DtxR family Mn-dependent transcriptional regulator
MLDPRAGLILFWAAAVAAALVLWPGRRLLRRWRHRRGRTDAVVGDDALKAVFHGRVRAASRLAREIGVTDGQSRRVMAALEDAGLLGNDAGHLSLTERGRVRALEVIRAHRLLERFLADRTGVDEREWHERAEDEEHQVTREDVERLERRMGRPLFDPHGDPIPDADGSFVEPAGEPLASCEPGEGIEVVHVEDEPDEAYRRLLGAGVRAGMHAAVLRREGDAVVLRAEGRELAVRGPDAPLVTVRRAAAESGVRVLADVAVGEQAVVAGLASACRGAQRRRLLDLGFVPGTVVTAERRAALGDPVAYRVRGALVALRRAHAAWVLVSPAETAREVA